MGLMATRCAPRAQFRSQYAWNLTMLSQSSM